MTNWSELSRARGLDIPDEAVARVAPVLNALERAFQPLRAHLTPAIEPAIVLSESAVLGE